MTKLFLIFFMGMSILQAAPSCSIDSSKSANPSLSQSKAGVTILKNDLILFSIEELKKHLDKNSRPIFLIVGKDSCPVWQKMFRNLASDRSSSVFLKNEFIVAFLPAVEINKYPQFYTETSPTIFLLDNKMSRVSDPVVGNPSNNNEEFLNWLRSFKTWYNQNYKPQNSNNR